MRLFWTVFSKELVIEWRSKEVIYTSLFFAILLATTFMFGFFEGERVQGALAGNEETYTRLGPGILWIGLIFAATITFSRSFAREAEAGCVQALRLVPGIYTPLFWGKCAANILILLAVECVLVPAVTLFFPMRLGELWLGLAFLMLLGTIGLVTIGTLLSAALVNLRMKEVLMPLVLFPLIVPLLVGAVSATDALVRDNMTQFWDWTRLMLAFDAIYIVVSTWLFRPVMEASE